MERTERKKNTSNARRYLPPHLANLEDTELAKIIDLFYQLAAAYHQKN